MIRRTVWLAIVACGGLMAGCSNPGAPSGDDSIESAILQGKKEAGITDNAVRSKDANAPTKVDPSAKPSGGGSAPLTTDDRDR